MVKFHLTGKEQGSYRVTILSSRGGGGSAVVLVSAGKGENQRVEIPIESTDGWGDYKSFTSSSTLFLPAGGATLRVQTGDTFRGEYLMNLRSITLTLEK